MGLAKTVATRFPTWGPDFATLMVRLTDSTPNRLSLQKFSQRREHPVLSAGAQGPFPFSSHSRLSCPVVGLFIVPALVRGQSLDQSPNFSICL